MAEETGKGKAFPANISTPILFSAIIAEL